MDVSIQILISIHFTCFAYLMIYGSAYVFLDNIPDGYGSSLPWRLPPSKLYSHHVCSYQNRYPFYVVLTDFRMVLGRPPLLSSSFLGYYLGQSNSSCLSGFLRICVLWSSRFFFCLSWHFFLDETKNERKIQYSSSDLRIFALGQNQQTGSVISHTHFGMDRRFEPLSPQRSL